MSRVCPASAIIRARARVIGVVKLDPCVGASSTGPYVLLVDPRLESVGLPCDWSLSGLLGIVPGARRTGRLLVLPNAEPLSLNVPL